MITSSTSFPHVDVQNFDGTQGLSVITYSDYEKLASMGKITGAQRIGKFGYNLAVDNTTEEHVWSPGGIMTFQTAAQTVEVLSSDTNDTNTGGSGARKVTLYGVDGDFNYVTEEVTMNGTSVVAVTQQFLRIYRMQVTSRGTYLGVNDGANVGTITARVASAGATMCEIPVNADFGGAGTSFTTHYTVPADKSAFVYYILINAEANKPMKLSAQIKTNDGNMTTAPFDTLHVHQFIFPNVDGYKQIDIQRLPFYLPAKTDVWFSAKGTSASAGAININYGIIEFNTPT